MSWIPAYRQMFERGHWLNATKRNPESRLGAWLDLCQMACWQDRTTARSGTLQRGELLVSVRTLARRWCWGLARVDRFMSELRTSTAIETVRGTPDGTVYRIVKYDVYAIGEKDCGTLSGTDCGTEAEQDKEVKKKKRKHTGGSDGFERVWKIHPRGSKAKAWDEYRTVVPDQLSEVEVESLLRRYVETLDPPRWRGHDLFRWLRDERWREFTDRAEPETRPMAGGFYVGN
jgi:hypothetical protein